MKNKLDPTIPHQEITFRIIGCAMRVHNRLGPGLREKMYQRALTAEMRADGLEVDEEHRVDVYDNDVWIGVTFPDHFVENKVVVEVEAFPHFLTKAEVAQTIGFLAAANAPVGLLIIFGASASTINEFCLPKICKIGKSISRVCCGVRPGRSRASRQRMGRADSG